MGLFSGLTDTTVTNQPSAQTQAQQGEAFYNAQQAAGTPYTPYSGQLVAPLNQGQRTAIGQLQSSYGLAQPYMDAGSQYISQGAQGLANVQNYLQAGAGAAANSSNYLNGAAGAYGQSAAYGQQSAQALAGMTPYMNSANSALGQAGTYYGDAAGYAAPVQFSQAALQQYMNPYTQDVINATMKQLNQNDQVQTSNLVSNSIGSGAYGGDRNGIAVAALAGQQDLSNNQTVAGLNQANYTQALGQFNQEQADRYQTANIYAGLGSGSLQQAAGYGNLATQQGQMAQQYGNLGTLSNQTGAGYTGLAQTGISQGNLYNTLGQLQGTTGAAQGNLGAQAGYLGSLAQGQAISGASAGLQGSTLAQALQQQQDTANYGQYQLATQYPFYTSGFLANIANGQAATGGSSTTNQGSLLSTAAGLGTLGILGASGISSLVPSISNLGANNANGGRVVERARGGPVGLAAVGHYANGGALPGLAALMRPSTIVPHSVKRMMRPRFDDGGLISFADPNALLGQNNPAAPNPMFASPYTITRSGGGSGAGNAGSAGLAGVSHGTPQGLGALSAAPTGSGSSAPPISFGSPTSNSDSSDASDPNSAPSPGGSAGSADSNGLGLSKNAQMGLLAAGLGMLSGTSGNGVANIGQGGLEGLKTYLGLNQQDRRNAITQQELGFKKRSQDLDEERVTQGAQQLADAANYHKAQIANEQQQTVNQTATTNANVAATRAGLVTTTPGIDPNTGNPGMWMFDRSNPSAGYKFLPLQGGAGGSSAASTAPAQPQSAAPISFNGASALNGTSAAPLPAGVPAAPTMPATPVSPSGPSLSGGVTGSWDGPTPSMPQQPASAPGRSSTAATSSPASWQAVTAPPPGYVPPNQAMLSLNPEMAKQQAELGGKMIEAQRDSYSKAASAQQQLAEMNASIDSLPRTGILAPGSYGTQRAAVAQLGNTVASIFGASPVFDENKSADTQELKKDAFRLGSQILANTNGGREAGFIIKASVGATPSMDNTYLGFKKVSAGLQQANQYAMDRAEFMDNYYSKFGHVSGAEAEFQKLNPWQTYSNKAIVSTVDPRDADVLRQNSNNPAALSKFKSMYGAPASNIILGQ